MKTLVIILFVIGVIVIGIIGYIGYSSLQIKQVYDSINQDALREEFDSVRDGDCSRLPVLEKRVSDIKEQVLRACNNPLINWGGKKYSGRDICLELKDPNNEVEQELQELIEDCAK